MHPRYINTQIQNIWLPGPIYAKWQKVELEVIRTRENQHQLPENTYYTIKGLLEQHPIDEAWLEKREAETKHDLIAFLDERRRHLPPELRPVFHEGMTSYDTEEPARALMLQESAKVILGLGNEVLPALLKLARDHRHTPMLGVTHGQWAGIMSLGARCAKWYMGLRKMMGSLSEAMEETAVAKLSGAIGTYSEVITPEVEVATLQELGLRPYFGATQIVPRYVWIRLAQAVLNVAEVLGNIAETMRLGARSGYTLTQEPFGAKQKGSSAMPHKRNPITWEKLIGKLKQARAAVGLLQSVCVTWEERDISESSVERDAWPDLFHAVAHMLTCTKRMLSGLVVNREAMLRQIRDSRGTYATDLAKGWLAERLATVEAVDDPADLAYRILQQASFQATMPSREVRRITDRTNETLADVDVQVRAYSIEDLGSPLSIQSIVLNGEVGPSEHFDAWQINRILGEVFSQPGATAQWIDLFKMSTYLRKEGFIFDTMDTMSQLP